MAHSNIPFNRWQHIHDVTWPFLVYKKYNEELSNYIWSNNPIPSYVYKNLGNKSANWTDTPSLHFNVGRHIHNFQTLKDWSESYKGFNKWTLLNAVVAMSSNLETYFSTIISLAIESNPGVLLGASKSIDGTILLKHSTLNKEIYNEHIINCTKGSWDKRAVYFKNLFGDIPNKFDESIKDLEQIRKLRNNVSHAFGRDIEKSRNFEVKEIMPINTISQKRLIKYLEVTYNIAKSIDHFLLDNHIGEYQILLAYHNIYPSLNHKTHVSNRAISFKKYYSAIDKTIGKEFCKGLAKYYESL